MPLNEQDLIKKAFELHKEDKLIEAETLYHQVLEKSPENVEILNLLGYLYIQKKQFLSAIEYLNKAIKINPKAFSVWFNLGLAYKNNNQIEDAIDAYQKALKIEPNHPDVYFNLANIYDNMNFTRTALDYFLKAYENGIKDENIHYFIGVCNLKLKNFEDGWEHYEHRPSKKFAITSQSLVYKDLMAKTPLWNGEDIKDKTLFVYYDSALGDTLMYARYLPILKDLCKNLLFKPQFSFIELFKENNFGAKIIDNTTLPQDVIFDTHIPMMSIPYVLKHNSESQIPFSEGYLKVNPEKAKEFKEKCFDTNTLKIGIKWKGNTAYDLERIISLKSFYHLFKMPNTTFYSIQKGEGIEEIDELPPSYKVVNIGKDLENFNDTAAVIENLDLIICNDTSVAHLAGAMGKPCWVLLPFVQNWRWHNDISYSPWYKSIKLFKQEEPGNWEEVFVRIKRELAKKI